LAAGLNRDLLLSAASCLEQIVEERGVNADYTLESPSLSYLVAAKCRHRDSVIWGDDIGPFNISAYNMGIMGYRTPNIDRIANEGMIFTDSYGDQSCTAGRAGFITGQHPARTGLTKVGLPGAKEGMQKEDPTIAGLLKPLGYTI
jgi:hypothetical protein